MASFVQQKKPRFPIVIEYSRIPIWLSKISPINIHAISFWIFIICKTKLSTEVWRHEMIHYRQQQELYFIGQWVLYSYFYIRGWLKYKNGKTAYRANPFEQEAYKNQKDPIYLLRRKKYAWKKFEI